MSDSLRIALLTYSTQPRGSVVHTLELARALKKLGHQPSVFALDKDGQGFGQALPFETYSVPAGPSDSGVDGLIRQRIEEFVSYFKQHSSSYDIFHAQDCIGANALAVLRQQGRIPHFARTVHHVEAFESPYLRDCQDRSIRLPDQCLCVSQFWREALWTDYGLRAERVFNGVDTDRFSAAPNGTEADLAVALGIAGGPIYLTVGGIEPRKNSIRLLQAFAQVLVQSPQAKLVIAGGATLFDYQPYRQTFLETAAELGIQPGQSLCLPGVIAEQDLPTLYRLADAFVFPSTKEGWGLVVLEAIATHLPVITSNQAPFTEFLTEDQALLVNPESVDAIATAMLQVTQPKVRQRLIANTRGVCDRFTWIRSAQHHITAYRSLLLTRDYSHA
ncbi:MSMEG_0565 family glycosyltransferase [Pseudanabaena sp. FACHB-2040]|uniref:MSMEG_0565 family glycosyltransferase n=1 Tax=Pseudanabaena sp. FACHB-2040 TaxID=2692859 RepID=UPI001689D4C4|nr:MSMEG_0565 family glycosyltransferase [Pseudanabaena sp. FACHB-2040]MBD2257557.1 MSMEG_0565 family glycosyltransferase [Pseudanabaena sp. FACHB-2040]